MVTEVVRGALVRPSDPDHVDALMFLITEAELLDAYDLTGWLELLAPEVDYRMPVQKSRLREASPDEPERSYNFVENRESLEFRVRRLLESNAVWSENPRPRVRRFVSNVRVRQGAGGELQVASYLLLLRSRHDLDSYDIVSAERSDVLGRRANGDLELRSREVTVDQTRLGIASLPIPF